MSKTYLKLKDSDNYFAFRFDKAINSFLGKILRVLFKLFGLAGLALLITAVFNYQPIYIDWGLRLIFIYLAFKIISLFYYDYLWGPKISVGKALKIAKDQSKDEKRLNLADTLDPTLLTVFCQGEYSPTDIALSLIDLDELNFVFNRAGIDRNILRQRLEREEVENVGSPESVLIKALQVAQAESHQRVRPGDLFVALTLIEPSLNSLIDELGIKTEDLLNIVYWYSLIRPKQEKFLDTSNFVFSGGVGKDWIFGYTRYLNRFSSDITELVRLNNKKLKYIGHKQVIEKVEKSLLSSRGGNIVLVGPEGSGKETSIYGLARRIVLGQSPGNLKLKRILKLDLESVLAGANSRGEIISRLNQVFREAEKVGNLILFIDNFTNLLSGKSLGQVDASQVLLPYLNSGSFSVIGTAEPGRYHRYIENSLALNQRMVKIDFEEPSYQEIIRILEDQVPILEQRANCFFRYLAIKEVVYLANKYIFDQPNPQKSLNLLDKVATENVNQIITKEKVREVASNLYKIPVGEASKREKKKLLNLEDALHQRVVNQNQAIEEISNAMRRSRAEVGQKGKKPIGSFLFIGPIGVGKTETAKALADNYFGGESKMNRFDMSEYQNKHDTYRLLGDREESGRPGQLSEVLKTTPHSLLLFDEIEKAHPDILNLFLQILDEGVATTTQGKRLVFSNSIIIATSNAGAEFIRKKIKEGVDSSTISEEILDYLMDKGHFKPELLNRFSSVVSFSPLTKKQIEKIAQIKLNKLSNQIKSEKDIEIKFGPRVPSEIASRGYNPEMGARPMERTIEDLIENLIAKKILAGELSRGDSLTIGVEDFED